MTADNSAALRPDVAAAYLSLSTQRLAKMRLTGEGPVYRKVGRSVLYLRSDLDAWLESLSRRSTSDPGAKAA